VPAEIGCEGWLEGIVDDGGGDEERRNV